jgi:hypothetical protein
MIQMLRGSPCAATSFDELDAVFKAAFHDLTDTAQNGIIISGVSPLKEPTQMDTDHLRSLCAQTLRAIALSSGPTSENQECVFSMRYADKDSNDELDSVEFVDFLKIWTKGKYGDATFDGLPYLLREEFEWSKTASGFVDIIGSNPINGTQPEKDHLELVCNRLKTVVEEDSLAMSLLTYCRTAYRKIGN